MVSNAIDCPFIRSILFGFYHYLVLSLFGFIIVGFIYICFLFVYSIFFLFSVISSSNATQRFFFFLSCFPSGSGSSLRFTPSSMAAAQIPSPPPPTHLPVLSTASVPQSPQSELCCFSRGHMGAHSGLALQGGIQRRHWHSTTSSALNSLPPRQLPPPPPPRPPPLSPPPPPLPPGRTTTSSITTVTTESRRRRRHNIDCCNPIPPPPPRPLWMVLFPRLRLVFALLVLALPQQP